MNGIERITKERQHQIDKYGEEHDASHSDYSLAKAASAYLLYSLNGGVLPAFMYGYAPDWCSPTDDTIKNLEIAGALCAAEIDRILARENNNQYVSSPISMDVDVFQYTIHTRQYLNNWLRNSNTYVNHGNEGAIIIPLMLRVNMNDWIIKTRDGFLSVCSDDFFRRVYVTPILKNNK